MGHYRLTLIEGDGIGPEVAQAACRVIAAAGVQVEWEPVLLGARAKERLGNLLPEEALASIRRNKIALKGPLTTPIGEGFPSVNVQLRKVLDLYATLRPVRNLPHVASRYQDVDIVVVRENTEDLYAGKEHEVVPGVVESLKIITEVASTRIARFAFDYATENGRKKVTAVHKANIMKLSDGLFLDCCRRVASQHPAIEYNELIVDNTCLQLVMDPWQFDVLLMENLYGDILSDLCAGLVGGLGIGPGAHTGKEGAVFEAVHGSWPAAAGKDIANPTALILSGGMMLRHLGEQDAAQRIEQAVVAVLGGGVRPRDLGGMAGTREYTDAICRELERGGAP